MNVLEYPVSVCNGKVQWPEIGVLEAEGKAFGKSKAPGNHIALVSVTEGPEIKRCLKFLTRCLGDRSLVMGVYAYECYDWYIERQFRGLIVYFSDEQDATHFRLGWSEFYSPDHPTRVLMDADTPAIAAA
jgi:hypothetical protein